MSRKYVSPYNGVHPAVSKVNPWQARIKVNGKERYLGVFPSQIQAAAAVRAARPAGTQGRRRFSTVITKKGQSWAEVQLTQSAWSKVDVADLDLVLGYAWYLSAQGYAVRHAGPGNRIVGLHRLLLGLADDDPHEPDHRNGDRLDNRRRNLRTGTPAQNAANRRKRAGTSSRFKGVTWDRGRKKWLAQIQVNRKTIFLGYFTVEEDAARAYDTAASEAFGEYAWLNRVPRRSAETGVMTPAEWAALPDQP